MRTLRRLAGLSLLLVGLTPVSAAAAPIFSVQLTRLDDPGISITQGLSDSFSHYDGVLLFSGLFTYDETTSTLTLSGPFGGATIACFLSCPGYELTIRAEFPDPPLMKGTTTLFAELNQGGQVVLDGSPASTLDNIVFTGASGPTNPSQLFETVLRVEADTDTNVPTRTIIEVTFAPAQVPEPLTLILLLGGGAGVMATRNRLRRR